MRESATRVPGAVDDASPGILQRLRASLGDYLSRAYRGENSGALILAMGDRFLGFARWLIGRASRAWAAFSAFLGAAMIALAFARLGIF